MSRLINFDATPCFRPQRTGLLSKDVKHSPQHARRDGNLDRGVVAGGPIEEQEGALLSGSRHNHATERTITTGTDQRATPDGLPPGPNLQLGRSPQTPCCLGPVRRGKEQGEEDEGVMAPLQEVLDVHVDVQGMLPFQTSLLYHQDPGS